MRSVCQSLNLLCTAVGSLAAASINAVCAPWIPDDLNRGRLDDAASRCAVGGGGDGGGGGGLEVGRDREGGGGLAVGEEQGRLGECGLRAR